jgi:hypothetical protein
VKRTPAIQWKCHGSLAPVEVGSRNGTCGFCANRPDAAQRPVLASQLLFVSREYDSRQETHRRDQSVNTLNEVFSTPSTSRRYEVWFVRIGLADGSGAWWFRYLLMNPRRGGCPENPQGMPVQVWATWFPHGEQPQSFIQGFAWEKLRLSAKGRSPLQFDVARNAIGENFCRGALNVAGHSIEWDLQYRSTFRVTLSAKGWIGFSRTPHSDALFSGHIALDGRRSQGSPLGFGVQGHNCGYRHRNFWNWTHAYFLRPGTAPSTLEALVYEMPFGLVFRKAVLWHEGTEYVFRNLRDLRKAREPFGWNFACSAGSGISAEVSIDGTGPGVHRLAYLRTDCSANFEVMNNSLAKATLRLERRGTHLEVLETSAGAVLEMVG